MMEKEQIINEILKAMIDLSFHGDFDTLYCFLNNIKDKTVLGDILADLKR